MYATVGGVRPLEDVRILVVGDAMLDEQVWGRVERISPEAPVPVVEVTRRDYRPGGAANVAANIAALGATARLVAVVGADRQAAILRERLAAARVDDRSLLVDRGRPTSTKSRILAPQQIVRIDEEDRRPLPDVLERRLVAMAQDLACDCDAVVLSDYGKGVLGARACAAIIDGARQAGCLVLADPKGRDFTKYRGASMLTPNAREACAALGDDPTRCETADAAGDALVGLVGGAVLVTRGADGMTLCRAGHPPFTVAAHRQQVFDVTGAGDTVIAALAVCMAAGEELEIAVALANYAAGLTVTKVGVGVVAAAELAAFREALAGRDLAVASHD